MRIVVVGTSGAGKTTLAYRIAAQLQLPHIELDAINWQSEWRDLTRHDPEEFVRRVTEAIQAEAYRRRRRVSARRHCPEFEEAGPVPVSAIIVQSRITVILTRLPNSGTGADALPDPGQ